MNEELIERAKQFIRCGEYFTGSEIRSLVYPLLDALEAVNRPANPQNEDLIMRLRKTAGNGVSAWGDLQIEAAKEIEILKAEREAYAAAMNRMSLALEAKWLPIESAPKNETEILLMYMHIETQIVHNGFWLDDEYEPEESGWWSYDKSEVSRVKLDDWMTPTHWMPLPAAPEPKP